VSSFAFTDATIWVAGYDFTGDSNQLALSVSVDELDNTTFGSGGYRSKIGGLRQTELEVGGFWQSATTDAVDPQVFPNLGTADRVVTLAPDDAETTPAYMFQAVKLGYTLFGQIGEVTPFSLTAQGSNGIGTVRGQVAKAKGSVSATGVLGSVVNLGAPTSTQYVYATLHVFSAGTTITVQVQSDTASNFPSATTQATIGPITSAGGTFMTRVAGPFVGETHWRLNVSAITGTFQVAGAIAVQ
jgi:hypothetical protein